LQQIFEKNPCKHPIVILKDVSYSDLKSVVSFIYNGEINVSQDCISGILAVSYTIKRKKVVSAPLHKVFQTLPQMKLLQREDVKHNI